MGLKKYRFLLACFASFPAGTLWAEETLPSETITAATQKSEKANPTQRRVDLRVSPLALFYGIYGGELQLGILPWLSFGGSFNGFNSGADPRRFGAHEYGVLASVYFEGQCFSGGWLVQPSVRYAPTSVGLSQTHDYDYSVVVGREWAWESGFNIFLAGGIVSSPADPTRIIEPLVIWQLGFAI